MHSCLLWPPRGAKDEGLGTPIPTPTTTEYYSCACSTEQGCNLGIGRFSESFILRVLGPKQRALCLFLGRNSLLINCCIVLRRVRHNDTRPSIGLRQGHGSSHARKLVRHKRQDHMPKSSGRRPLLSPLVPSSPTFFLPFLLPLDIKRLHA